MIRGVLGREPEVTRFVAEAAGLPRGFGDCTAVAWMDGDELVAGTVYHNWYPEHGTIELSTAAMHPRWLTRKSLRQMFDYPFNQLGCQMVVLRVGELNSRMRGIARRYGFAEVVIPRLRGRDEADCVFTLTVEQWREKEAKYGMGTAESA